MRLYQEYKHKSKYKRNTIKQELCLPCRTVDKNINTNDNTKTKYNCKYKQTSTMPSPSTCQICIIIYKLICTNAILPSVGHKNKMHWKQKWQSSVKIWIYRMCIVSCYQECSTLQQCIFYDTSSTLLTRPLYCPESQKVKTAKQIVTPCIVIYRWPRLKIKFLLFNNFWEARGKSEHCSFPRRGWLVMGCSSDYTQG